MNHQEICQCRHPKELKLFGFASIVSIILLIAVFAGSFFRTEIIETVKSEIVTTYKLEHPAIQNLSDVEIIKKLPEDDKDTLEFLENYYHWFTVPLIPVVFFFLVLFAIGKRYGDLRGGSVRLDKHQYPQVYKIFGKMASELGFKEVPELSSLFLKINPA